MAKSKPHKESAKPAGPPATSEDSKASKASEPKAAAVPEPEQKPSPEPQKPQVPESLISFDRWFRAKGFKPTWKEGMAAYTDTTVRRTLSEWDGVFKDY